MKKRIFETDYKTEIVQSYLGLLGYGGGWKLREKIKQLIETREMI